jgi:S1-C subfamily serine protease
MNLLGPLAKVLAAATGGRQPEDQLHPRGFLGVELTEAAEAVRVADVLADSPAARAGVRPGDRLVRVLDHEVTSIKAARDAVAAIRAGDRVGLVVRRSRGAGSEDEEVTLTLTAGDGL